MLGVKSVHNPIIGAVADDNRTTLIRDGNLFILRDGWTYNVLGEVIK